MISTRSERSLPSISWAISYPRVGWDFLRRYPVIPAIIIFVLVLVAVFEPILSPVDPV